MNPENTSSKSRWAVELISFCIGLSKFSTISNFSGISFTKHAQNVFGFTRTLIGRKADVAFLLVKDEMLSILLPSGVVGTFSLNLTVVSVIIITIIITITAVLIILWGMDAMVSALNVGVVSCPGG